MPYCWDAILVGGWYLLHCIITVPQYDTAAQPFLSIISFFASPLTFFSTFPLFSKLFLSFFIRCWKHEYNMCMHLSILLLGRPQFQVTALPPSYSFGCHFSSCQNLHFHICSSSCLSYVPIVLTLWNSLTGCSNFQQIPSCNLLEAVC